SAHLVDLVLEASQRLDDPLEKDILAAADADLAFDHPAAGDGATGDIAALGELEQLADLGGPHNHLLEDRVQEASHGFLHLVDQFVDDGIEFDLDAFALGNL